MIEARIIITGSKNFNDYNLMKQHFCSLIRNKMFYDKNIVRIITGEANDANKLGEKIVREYGLKLTKFTTDWEQFGRKAEYIKNINMAKYAIENHNIGILMAFWNNKSRGTKNMIDMANKYNLEVHIINF